MFLYVLLIVILVFLDQLFKFLVRLYLTSNSFVEVIPNLIHLTYQENRGISFSFLANLPDSYRIPLLTGVSALVIIGLTIYLFKNRDHLNVWEKLGFSLILAGALGNLIDRAFRQQVTDYMYFHFYDVSFFVNNFADDLISVGFILMIWQSFRGKSDGKK